MEALGGKKALLSIMLALLARECHSDELKTAWERNYSTTNLGPTGDISKPVEDPANPEGICWVTKRKPNVILDTIGQIPQYCNFESDGTRGEKCCYE